MIIIVMVIIIIITEIKLIKISTAVVTNEQRN